MRDRERKQNARRLLEQLRARGVSEADLRTLGPYLVFVAEREGGTVSRYGTVFLGVLGLGAFWFATTTASSSAGEATMVLAGLVFLAIPAFFLRERRRALAVKRALLDDPEQFLGGEPHPYEYVEDEVDVSPGAFVEGEDAPASFD